MTKRDLGLDACAGLLKALEHVPANVSTCELGASMCRYHRFPYHPPDATPISSSK